jgi:hypothetical protein
VESHMGRLLWEVKGAARPKTSTEVNTSPWWQNIVLTGYQGVEFLAGDARGP